MLDASKVLSRPQTLKVFCSSQIAAPPPTIPPPFKKSICHGIYSVINSIIKLLKKRKIYALLCLCVSYQCAEFGEVVW